MEFVSSPNTISWLRLLNSIYSLSLEARRSAGKSRMSSGSRRSLLGFITPPSPMSNITFVVVSATAFGKVLGSYTARSPGANSSGGSPSKSIDNILDFIVEEYV